MVSNTNFPWDSLEKRNAGVFLFAGVMAFSYAILKGLKAYAGLEVVTVFDVIWGGFVLLVPVIALLGLYPLLQGETPRLSVAALAATMIAGIAIVAIQLQLIFTTLTMEGYPEIPGDGPAWPVFALFLTFVTLSLGFLLSSLAARRTEVVSPTVASLLVVPFLGWIGLIVANIVLPSGDYLGMFAYAPIGVALLAVGYLLRVEVPSERVTTAADAPT